MEEFPLPTCFRPVTAMAGHQIPGTGHPRVTLTGFTHPEGKAIVIQRPGLREAALGRERQNPVLSRECRWAGSIFFV